MALSGFLHKKTMISLFSLASLIIFSSIKAISAPLFSFGMIADCQYADVETSESRNYRLSPEKLQEAVNFFETQSPSFVVHLGDFIDRDWESYKTVSPIINQLSIPLKHVLGNHDFNVAEDKKEKVPNMMNLGSRYYQFKHAGFRFVVLDGNDLSLHAHPKGTESYKKSLELYETHYSDQKEWNGAIGKEQLEWLENVLISSQSIGEKVIIFCHFPVFPENFHNLWNAKEVLGLLGKYKHVVAYFNGHNHAGHYGIQSGTHYLTLKGMLMEEDNAFSMAEVYEDRIEVYGFGREERRTLKFNQP